MGFFKSDPPRKGSRGEVLPAENEGPPDSHRPSGLCPRCGKQSSFEVIGFLPVAFNYETVLVAHNGRSEHDSIEQVCSLFCRHCKQGLVSIEERYTGDSPSRLATGGGIISFRGFHWWPLPNTQLSSDIPTEIAGAFAEAVTALAANCPRAAGVMARRTLEAITVEKGETQGTLADRLRTLATRGVLLPTLADWAREVRLVGNVGAHFDPINQISKDDAQQLINFIRELMRYLYELPADLARRRSPTP
jgi:hypothetical protein